MEKAFGRLGVKFNATWVLIFLWLGLLSPGALGQAIPIAPPNNVGQCLACHGPMGKPDDTSVPIIGGQHADYLANALRAYQNGLRTGESAEIMSNFLRTLELDEASIKELANFFSSLRPRR
ncbi:MAG: c-type cytochrome [Alphaproteobacteria bacterium]|jgi:cytochrome c553